MSATKTRPDDIHKNPTLELIEQADGTHVIIPRRSLLSRNEDVGTRWMRVRHGLVDAEAVR